MFHQATFFDGPFPPSYIFFDGTVLPRYVRGTVQKIQISFQEEGVPPSFLLYSEFVPPNYFLFGITVPSSYILFGGIGSFPCFRKKGQLNGGVIAGNCHCHQFKYY